MPRRSALAQLVSERHGPELVEVAGSSPAGGSSRLYTLSMTALPLDLALALASAGIAIDAPDDELEAALRSAIADRRGYLGDVVMTDLGYRAELLSPATMLFQGRTRPLALAWVLIYLMGETGEIGLSSFSA